MSSPKSKRDILKNSQEREKKIRKVKLTMGLLLVVILVGGFVGILNYSLFRIKGVSVVGESAESKDQVKAFVFSELSGRYFGIIPKDNTFFFSKVNLSSRLGKKFPRLAEVKIRLSSLDSLVIEISDKNARLIWCEGETGVKSGRCFYVNSDGEIYSESPNFSSTVMAEVVAPLSASPIGQKVMASSTLEKISGLVATLKRLIPSLAITPVQNQVSHLELLGAGDWKIVVSQSNGSTWQVIFNEKKPLSQLVGSLSSTLNNETFLADWTKKAGGLDYIDLRFDNKIFYRFKK